MPKTPPAPDTLLPLSEAVFQILLALAHGSSHGYRIMQDIEEQTGGRVRMGPGTLYGAIKRLREQGLVAEVDATETVPSDERRRYYALTPFGLEVARREARRLEGLVGMARRKLLVPKGGVA